MNPNNDNGPAAPQSATSESKRAVVPAAEPKKLVIPPELLHAPAINLDGLRTEEEWELAEAALKARRQQASDKLALRKSILEQVNAKGLTMRDLGWEEIEHKPVKPNKRATAKAADEGDAVPAKKAAKRGRKPKAAAAETPKVRKLLKVLKKDPTIPFTGGRCHAAGRDKNDKMDPKKWRDPTDAELQKWERDGTLS